jgi:glutamate-ammonia-ligase adenylyltransferase
VSADLLEEIADLKVRIERELVGAEDLHRNVKLGFGGIREIEFIVQTLQLLHGARNAFLQERSTMKALTALEQLQILPREDVATLRQAYIFLRAIEHRLQIVNEQQTHTLPTKAAARLPIARSLGFESIPAFDQTLSTHTHAVRRIFKRLLGEERESPKQKRVLDFFREAGHAEKGLAHLRDGTSNVHVAPRTRRLYAKLEPELLRRLRHLADPDGALNRFTRFVDGYGIRGLLFETLLANPRLFELLLQLFDASAVFSEIVIRRPQLVEEIARGRSLGRQLTATEFMDDLTKNAENLPVADWIRVYRRAEVLRILLRDILGFASLEELQTEMTDLAEACLRFAMAVLEAPNELTVLALGKIGGRELLYGADLDLVFIGQESAPAEKLISLMSTKTSEGRVFSIDCRLRPEGGSAPLVVSCAGYEAYFAKRAQLWELQALTKSRVLSGPEAADLARIVDQIWSSRIGSRQLRSGIHAMYRRVVRERSKQPDDLSFKTGCGGLVAIEFLVQFFQMRDGLRESNTLAALDKLTLQLSDGERETLRNAYRFLRKMESVLRRVDNVSISILPAHEDDQQRLASRMGFDSREAFLDEYRARREQVASLIDQHMGRV